jgi:hypothetical protein
MTRERRLPRGKFEMRFIVARNYKGFINWNMPEGEILLRFDGKHLGKWKFVIQRQEKSASLKQLLGTSRAMRAALKDALI